MVSSFPLKNVNVEFKWDGNFTLTPSSLRSPKIANGQRSSTSSVAKWITLESEVSKFNNINKASRM